MRRWGLALAAVLLACLPIWLTRSANEGLLRDTDTRVLLERLEARNAPLSWFVGDWPLENHFYRPVTTLVFELDQRLHPWSPSGFGTTQALLAVGCVLALFWFLRELLDQPLLAAASAALFALWNAYAAFPFDPQVVFAIVALPCLAVALIPGRRPLLGVAGVFAAWYAGFEVQGLVPIRGGALDWIPGRTATVMTLFALCAMASYARFERLGAPRKPRPEATALDKPATKGTRLRGEPSRWNALWAIAAILFAAFAFGAYEQAVMLPACLTGVAVVFHLAGYRPRWGWQVAFWGLIVLYWLARKAFIPPGASEYQLQQYRSSFDVLYTVLDYLFPAFRQVLAIATQLDLGIASLFLTQIPTFGRIVANAVAYGWAIRSRRLEPFLPWIAGYALSAIAFLPMAWMKQFPVYNHYHYWSLSLRSMFAVATVWMAVELLKRAMTPRAIQAPRRLVPAPGSLPRP